MKRRHLKRTVTALAAVVFSGALGATAMAQEWPGRNPDVSHAEVANFDQYLDHHPDVAARLAADPRLINDPRFVATHPDLHAYLANHPGLHEFLAKHPVARADWKSHPYRYMTREETYDQRH